MGFRLLIVGCGLRAATVLKELVAWEEDLVVSAVVDPNREYAAGHLASAYKGPEPRYFADIGSALESGPYEGALLATRCDLHADYAERLMEAGLPLFMEKPVGRTAAELDMLEATAIRTAARVVCSFPLRTSPLVTLAKELLESGKIGAVEQVQAVNNVPYGGVYYHSWYRDDGITGGLWLQKATHDFDYILHLVGQKPTQICAMDSKGVFRGDKPAGLTCGQCAERKTCPESPFVLTRERFEDVQGEGCCFAVDTGNQDSGTAIVRFASGAHGTYTQNFVARKAAARRGARFIGYRGTLEFDWYTNELTVVSHMVPTVERHSFDTAKMSHFGGDRVLAQNFLEVARGGESVSPMEAGILSARLCLAAEKSCRNQVFVGL